MPSFKLSNSVFFISLFVGVPNIFPQEEAGQPTESLPPRIEIKRSAQDEDIAQRIQAVLTATGWFERPRVDVNEGVVFLYGETETDELKKWASELARNTQDVVAVANQMEVQDPSVWDFGPAWAGLARLWRDFVHSIPFLFFGILVLLMSVGASFLAKRYMCFFLLNRVQANLLRKVIAGAAGILVFLGGVYIVLRVAGLTQLALTVVGGTGLVGLALGIAFRDITENFLASVFLSIQKPFHTGDLVEITGTTGYVQQLNMRTTILMTLDGNLVQIPNASVYKTNILNFTTNVNRREDFVVGIGYDDSVNEAQSTALEVLHAHPAVLDDPEPAVLVDSLGSAIVSLRVYFWLNGKEHSWLKVRSSVIRLVKRRFQLNGISMPDEAREVVFPDGITVDISDKNQPSFSAKSKKRSLLEDNKELDEPLTKAEAGLYSDAAVISGQAKQAHLKTGENLLEEPK